MKELSVYSKLIILLLSFFLYACAGPNPNIGERTTDIGWTTGNYQKVFDTAIKYAEKGQPWAQLRIGIFYANGWGVKKDKKIALVWYQKAAAQTALGDWSNGQMVKWWVQSERLVILIKIVTPLLLSLIWLNSISRVLK